MTREIRHTFYFEHPVERVWDYLTEPELLVQWLMPNDIRPVVGHKFQMKTRPRKSSGFDGTVYCKVLEVEPFRKLVYSWKGGMGEEHPTLDSIVTWTLSEKEGGTELTLKHSGFKGFKNLMAYYVMNIGWKKIGNRLNYLMNDKTHAGKNT